MLDQPSACHLGAGFLSQNVSW